MWFEALVLAGEWVGCNRQSDGQVWSGLGGVGRCQCCCRDTEWKARECISDVYMIFRCLLWLRSSYLIVLIVHYMMIIMLKSDKKGD